MIEVELRGGIEGDFQKVLGKFRKKAKFLREEDRFKLIYFREGIDFSHDVLDIRDDPVDLKLRVTNKKAEIALKYGVWGGKESRKEILIPIPLEKFEEAIDLLSALGWRKGTFLATKTFVFEYKGIEFALVNSGTGKNYFEAERAVENKEKVKKEHEKIEKACGEMDLKLFSVREFADMLNYFNNYPDYQFDFSKKDFSGIKKKYKEFF